MRTHLLTAEAPDTLLIVINRGLIFSIPEIHRFARYRTAVDTDSTTDTLIWLDVRLLLKNIQGLGKSGPDIAADFGSIHIKVRISILLYQFLQ